MFNLFNKDLHSLLYFNHFQFKNLLALINSNITYHTQPHKWNQNFHFDQYKQFNQVSLFNPTSRLKVEKFNITTDKNNKIRKIKIYEQIFALFVLFSYSLSNEQFKPHPFSKLFLVQSYKKDLFIVDTKPFFSRWKDSFNLIFNIFYYKLNPIIFSSPYFKNEVLGLNWNYSQFDINLWRYYFPFLIFKINKYNPKILYYFHKLANSRVDFFIISDCSYHYKTTYYIKKKKLYSIGLVSISINPWLVTYPIIGFFDSYVTQFFFFKLLISEERKARYLRYTFFKKIWFLLINKILPRA